MMLVAMLAPDTPEYAAINLDLLSMGRYSQGIISGNVVLFAGNRETT